MEYYIYIENGQIQGKGQARILNETFLNVEVEEEVYNEAEKYIWDGADLVLDPDYEEKEAQKERERIGQLYLTGADVERGIYQAKGMDFEDILDMVKTIEPQGLDIKALKIELKANNFYRGNPYVNAIGQLLGFTEEQLDKFFETNDYTVLLDDPRRSEATSEVESTNDPSLTQEESKEEIFDLEE